MSPNLVIFIATNRDIGNPQNKKKHKVTLTPNLTSETNLSFQQHIQHTVIYFLVLFFILKTDLVMLGFNSI